MTGPRRIGDQRKIRCHAGHAHLAHTGAHAHLPPQPVGRQRDLRHQRPAHADRKVIPWPERRIVERRMVEIVDDVDPADERHVVIHDGELAMQAPQVATLQAKASHRPIDAPSHARRVEHRCEVRRQRSGSEPVDGQMDFDAPPCSPRERLCHAAPGRIVGVDVRFDRDAARGAIDRFDQRGEEFAAAAQQVDVVARQGLTPPPFRTQRPGIMLALHGRASSASSGTWSERCAHSRPVSACARSTSKPRT